MTRPELLEVMDAYLEEVWDQRYWELSQKADNPAEAYNEVSAERAALKNARKVEELPPEQQSWLRAT